MYILTIILLLFQTDEIDVQKISTWALTENVERILYWDYEICRNNYKDILEEKQIYSGVSLPYIPETQWANVDWEITYFISNYRSVTEDQLTKEKKETKGDKQIVSYVRSKQKVGNIKYNIVYTRRYYSVLSVVDSEQLILDLKKKGLVSEIVTAGGRDAVKITPSKSM